MNETLKQVLECTKQALAKNSFNARIFDERLFYQIAREGGLSGLFYPVINKDNLSNQLQTLLQKDFYGFNTRDAKQTAIITHIKAVFNTHQIKHVLLKGSYYKTLYPESYMRSMGDIDILIEKDNLERADIQLKSIGFKLTSKGHYDYHYTHDNGLWLELHYHLIDYNNEHYIDYFNHPFDNVYQVTDDTYQFNPVYELMYYLFHTNKHFKSSGVGLRTILDLSIWMNHHHSTLDIDALKQALKMTQFDQLFKNLMILTQRYFDTKPPTAFNKDTVMSNDLFNTLTDYIVTSGVHGNGMHFNYFLGRLSLSKNKKTFLLTIIFPPLNAMRILYPILHKHPYLLPITWCMRIGSRLIKSPKLMVQKLKQTRIDETTIETTQNLYKELGIR